MNYLDIETSQVNCNAPLALAWPMPGDDTQDWVINNYVDLDAGVGFQDYQGGQKTYDGHTGVDIDVPTFRDMDNGFPILASAAGVVVGISDGILIGTLKIPARRPYGTP